MANGSTMVLPPNAAARVPLSKSSAEVEPPKGDYVLPEDTSRQYVFVAGGIGLSYLDPNFNAVATL